MNNILLLGGTGFLGKPLLQKLETKNSVKIMIHNSNLQTSAKKFKGDILIQKSFSKEKPGKVITNDLEISCGTNSIKILEIQREGKKSQKIKLASKIVVIRSLLKGLGLIEIKKHLALGSFSST